MPALPPGVVHWRHTWRRRCAGLGSIHQRLPSGRDFRQSDARAGSKPAPEQMKSEDRKGRRPVSRYGSPSPPCQYFIEHFFRARQPFKLCRLRAQIRDE